MSDTFTKMLDEYFTLVYDFAIRPKVTAWDHIEPVGKIEKQREKLIAFVNALQDNEMVPYTPPAIRSQVICVCPLCHDDPGDHERDTKLGFHTSPVDRRLVECGCACDYCLGI